MPPLRVGGDRAQLRLHDQRPPGVEDVVGVGEVGLGVLDDAAERLERRAGGVDHLADGRFVREPQRGPGDLRALEVAAEWLPEAGAVLGQADRAAAVGPGHGAQEQGHVGHGAAHGTFHAQRLPAQLRRPGGDPARRRAQTDHVAEAGRVAERPTHVAAVGERDHPTGQGHGCAAAAAAAGLGEVVGVEGGAEDRVERLAAGTELGHVGLADHDGARGPLPGDEQGVDRRHEVGEQGRAEGGPDACGQVEVLDRQRQPVERSRPRAAGKGVVGSRGLVGGALGGKRDDGVDARVDPLDPVEVCREHLARRHLAVPQPSGQRGRGQEAQLVGHAPDARGHCCACQPSRARWLHTPSIG